MHACGVITRVNSKCARVHAGAGCVCASFVDVVGTVVVVVGGGEWGGGGGIRTGTRHHRYLCAPIKARSMRTNPLKNLPYTF